MAIGSVSLSNFVFQSIEELKPKILVFTVLAAPACVLGLMGRAFQINSGLNGGKPDALCCALAVSAVAFYCLAY